MTNPHQDDDSIDEPQRLRRTRVVSTSSRTRRDANKLFLAVLFLITNILTTAGVDGANNNNHHTGNSHSNGGNHGGNGSPPASAAQDEEPETFEDHVNITLPPNSKEISYWMYSMKTPGHIDMSHLLFHTTDDENNISSDTKNSAVRFNGFRRGCCTHNLSASFSCFLTPIFYYFSLLCSRSLLLDKNQQ